MSQASFHIRGGTWALSGRAPGSAVSSASATSPARGTVGPGLASAGTARPSIHIAPAKRADSGPHLHQIDDKQIPHMYSDGRYPRSIGLYGEARSFCRRPIGP